MGILFAFLTALAFSIANIVVKQGYARSGQRDNGLFITVFINVIILGLFFATAAIINGFSFSFQAFAFFVLAGLLTTSLGRFFLFSGIQRIGPSRAAAIKNAAPMFTLIYAVFILGETISWAPMIGMGMLLTGILFQGVVFFRKTNGNKETAGSTIQWSGYVFAVSAAVIFGIGQGVRKQGLMMLDDAFFGAWVGALASMVFVLIYEKCNLRLKSTIKRNFMIFNPYYLMAGVLTSLGPLFFFLAASYIQVAYVSVIAAIEPLLTVLLIAFLFKKEEKITVSIWATVGLMLFGTIVIAFST